MNLPRRVTLIEVGLRDGLQNETRIFTTDDKVTLAGALLAAGVREMEAVSVVNPKTVPQMAEPEAVMSRLRSRTEVRFSALVPSLRGTQRAMTYGVQELRYGVLSTETYNKINWKMSIAESLSQVQQSAEFVRRQTSNLRLVGYVSAAFGCPYEGEVSAEQVLSLVRAYVSAGMNGVILADSAGMGNPKQIQDLTGRVRELWPDLEITMHFHDTRGMGLANVLACLELGIDRFDTAIAGLGGCPFSPGSSGNICTVDTAHMLAEMGIETGLDLDCLISAAHLAENMLGRQLPGQVYRAGRRPVSVTAPGRP